MDRPPTPVPTPDADSRPFWEAAAAGLLVLQRCGACGRFVHYPRALCPHCLSERLAWCDASGDGAVYTFTVVHRAPDAFRDDVPYVVALVELAEGPRLMSRIVECRPDDVHVGMAVRVAFEPIGGGLALPVLAPATGGGP